MKVPKITNAVGHIDDDLISEAALDERKSKSGSLIKWVSVAACLTVIIIVSVVSVPLFFNKNNSENESSFDGGNINPSLNENRYKKFTIHTNEAAIIWPEEYKTVCEKYTQLNIDGIEYSGKGREIAKNLLSELIGVYTVFGYDEITEEKHTKNFEVYSLKYANESQFVSVRMEDAYYVFQNNKYYSPATLGELFEVVDMKNAIELNRFSVNGDSPDNKHFSLNSDDYIWDALSQCQNAEFVDESAFDRKNYISFTITSDTLGIYKRAMYITEDGYFWTNAFDWQYIFNIGKDFAGKIIKFAKENSTGVSYEPFYNSALGKISEITDEYILIDDSILCKNPDDGIVYKVLLNDLRISRYFDKGVFEVGDTVQISYEGKIVSDIERVIDKAISASKVWITDGDVLITE